MNAYGHPEARGRRRAMLRTAMGPAIADALADPAVIEVMLNPDGSLRLDRLSEGRRNHILGTPKSDFCCDLFAT
jgi:Flp pilus assembly CpaF family ATPase